jgi:hypothetical protein
MEDRMKLKNRCSSVKIALPVMLMLGMIAAVNAQGVFTELPDKIDTQARYLFYLHGAIVENKGLRPVSERYGVYEYEKILATFKARGFMVISEARPRNTNTGQYVQKVVSQVKDLLQAGVPPGNITVVGASKGGFITLLISTALQNKEVNFVILAGCNNAVLRFDIDLYGNILSIYDEKDEIAGSCEKIFEKSTGLNAHKELKLKVGTGHGIVYKPLAEWIEPAVRWAKGERQ